MIAGMIGGVITVIEAHVIEEAHVRAAATVLVSGCRNLREALLTASLMDTWEPEFTARVQRRLEEIAPTLTSGGAWL